MKGKNRRPPLQKVAARYEMHIAVALLYGCGVSQNCLSSQLPFASYFLTVDGCFPEALAGSGISLRLSRCFKLWPKVCIVCSVSRRLELLKMWCFLSGGSTFVGEVIG